MIMFKMILVMIQKYFVETASTLLDLIWYCGKYCVLSISPFNELNHKFIIYKAQLECNKMKIIQLFHEC